MHEGDARGAGDLHPAKEIVRLPAVGVRAGDGDDLRDDPAGKVTEDGGKDEAVEDLDPLAHVHAVKATGDGEGRAGKAGDEGVGLGGRDTEDPRGNAPGNDADGRRRERDHGKVGVAAEVDHA